MSGRSEGEYGQSFYQSGYDMDSMQRSAPPGTQQAGWHQTPAAAAPEQWSMAGHAQQAYYPPPAHGQQSYAQQEFVPSVPVGGGVSGGGGGGMERNNESEPGSLGQMDGGSENYAAGTGYGSTFEDEPPLLQELGIDFGLIKEKTLSVLNPMWRTDERIASDTDLAGPLIFCLLFGIVLLLNGKVHFGYIYGVSFLGCVCIYVVLNLMSGQGVGASCVVSVLGYCLLPMVLLSCVSILTSLQGVIGTVFSLLTIMWCSHSASKLFVSALAMDSQQLLIAYPCALLYGVFALLTIF